MLFVLLPKPRVLSAGKAREEPGHLSTLPQIDFELLYSLFQTPHPQLKLLNDLGKVSKVLVRSRRM